MQWSICNNERVQYSGEQTTFLTHLSAYVVYALTFSTNFPFRDMRYTLQLLCFESLILPLDVWM